MSDRFKNLEIDSSVPKKRPHFDDYNCCKVSLVDFSKDHEKWVSECTSKTSNHNSTYYKLSEEGNIEFIFEELIDYHDNRYITKCLIIELPKQIQCLLKSIKESGREELQKEMKKLLDIRV